MDYFTKYKWLSGVHFHVGSQGIPLDLFVKGAKVCMEFIEELESKGILIRVINIGGGLSTSYHEPDEPSAFSYQAYRDALEKDIPILFSGKYKLFTEFGRSLLLKAGTTLTKVENVKQWIQEEPPIVQCHIGANQFYTEVLVPHVRRHRIRLADDKGQIKEVVEENLQEVDIASCIFLEVEVV